MTTLSGFGAPLRDLLLYDVLLSVSGVLRSESVVYSLGPLRVCWVSRLVFFFCNELRGEKTIPTMCRHLLVSLRREKGESRDSVFQRCFSTPSPFFSPPPHLSPDVPRLRPSTGDGDGDGDPGSEP